MAGTMSSTDAARLHDLTSLITTVGSANAPASSSSHAAAAAGPSRKLYPSDDSIVNALHLRSRIEHPYTRVSPSGREYVAVNPLRMLGCMGEESRKAYQKDIEDTDGSDGRADGRQPSVYELAGRVWLLMSRQRESQSIVYHGVSGSGKSTSLKHTTTQILHLAATTKAQKRISDQIQSFLVLLESFGHSKTPVNPSASQHGKYFELHFSSDGRISGAKVLPFGLNKSRVGKLKHEERSFHVFYQLLAGASPKERDELNLEHPETYALLAASGCYRLPGGPFSDDSTQLSELRVALASLGFKAKHVRSIFSLLTAILLLSNLTFTDDRGHGSLGMTSMDERAHVVDRTVLAEVAGLLGVSPDDLEAVLVNRTKWVRRDLCSMFLDAEGAALQRDSLTRDLYAILFTFIVEMANKRLAPPNDAAPELQIVQLDLPGYQSRTMTQEPGARPASMLALPPLVNASGENGFDEFSINYINELVQSHLTKIAFDDSVAGSVDMLEDGLRLPSVVTMDNAACVELLRGGVVHPDRLSSKAGGVLGLLDQKSEEFKGEEREDVRAEQLLDTFTSAVGRHASFVVAPGVGLGPLPSAKHSFGINHYAGQCTYDAGDFVERNNDVLDKQLVDLLRSSADSFVSKLVSGPGLAIEGHPLDANITVEAQVSVTPLRTPTVVVNPISGAPASRSGAWPLDVTMPQPVASQLDATLSVMLCELERTRAWSVLCVRPNDSGHANSFDKRRVKTQVRSMLIPDLINRRQIDYIADYSLSEFCIRHSLRADDELLQAVETFANLRGWRRGADFAIGRERIWLGWDAWKEQDDLLRASEGPHRGSGEETLLASDESPGLGGPPRPLYGDGGTGIHTPFNGESTEDLLIRRRMTAGDGRDGRGFASNRGPYLGYRDEPEANASAVWSEYSKPEGPVQGLYDPIKEERSGAQMGGGHYHHDKDLGGGGDDGNMIVNEKKHHHATEVVATTRARRWWLRITWLLTWWIPSFTLRWFGKMHRADVRMAWREKVAIFMMVMFACGLVLFYIIVFGMLLCPDSAKAWNTSELATHQGGNDFYAAIAGKVYDFTNFYKGQHSDLSSYPTSPDVMLQFAGQDLTNYFPPPMTVACPGLVTNTQLQLQYANFTPILAYAVHTSGPLQTDNKTKLHDINWYENRLSPDLVQYYKGSYVFTKSDISAKADSDSIQWAIYNNKVYDLSNYLYTVKYYSSSSGTDLPNYSFLNSDLSSLFQTNAGQDITTQMNAVFDKMTTENVTAHKTCLDRAFYLGELDFRLTARCTVQNYLLLAFSVILMTTIAMKFLAALQLGSKRQPELLDKFVICQVPCYTEGEESLKRTIDSLAILNYDDKRKLIFIICDGNIIGSGNNRPTPRIVLDILGVDPKLDPEPLLFKSIGDGSKQLNYAKVYSGLYEHEGHVVPYVVIVKVGKPTETSKPGNRGKRDSQVLLLQYLNRVHFDAPMSPLELEIYHQMRNVIGIDPTFYEYIFQVDADTTVEPDSLNRMISCAADDQKIIGICGETKLENERESLTTMIQVYEYYISHHLTKAFESLFGSVTCLPGCFSVYRIRTADKGRPVIISSIVIDEYAEPNVDTLHKKNLFSLGEDRYLTTLMMKHFPTFKMKFTPDAIAHTVAPSRWNVLLSQRRRWINSTVHNLAELLFLPEMCGFCFFSMRFVVFIDLLGTIILPATCGYLIFLIVIVSTGKAAIPIISLAMIAAVYGLQAIIFILKREFMLIGWMLLYIAAFPIYSVFLPLYSFWSMDDFSWGNTRQVVGEGNNKTIVYDDDEPFHDSMIPYKSFKEYESNAWETASLHSEKSRGTSSSQSQSRTDRSRLPRMHGSRAPSMASSRGGGAGGMPPGTDFYRDSSPLGQSHVSRNLRQSPSVPSLHHSSSNPYMGNNQRVVSMGGMSMWGGASAYDGQQPGQQPPFLQPMMTGMSGMSHHPHMQMPHNPFDSPYSRPGSFMAAPGAGAGGMYAPYGQPMTSSPLGPGGGPGSGLGAPRGSVMTNLGGYGGGMGDAQMRASSYSLAASAAGAHPLAEPPRSSMDPNPSEDKILDTLRKYLASQDLMTVTKRQTREALYGLFPNASLQERAPWINENIDKILSEN